jgi:hypothetical protein
LPTGRSLILTVDRLAAETNHALLLRSFRPVREESRD